MITVTYAEAKLQMRRLEVRGGQSSQLWYFGSVRFDKSVGDLALRLYSSDDLPKAAPAVDLYKAANNDLIGKPNNLMND